MSQKKAAFKRELVLALDLKQVCLCSVETVETTCFLLRLMYKLSFFVSSHVSSDFLLLAEETSFLSENIFLMPLNQLLAQSVLGQCSAEQRLLASLLTC